MSLAGWDIPTAWSGPNHIAGHAAWETPAGDMAVGNAMGKADAPLPPRMRTLVDAIYVVGS